MTTERDAEAHSDNADLPLEGSEAFFREVRRIQRELVEKFAWTAQHDGIVYRHDPASIRPMDDHTFARVSRQSHSFRYRKRTGRVGVFFYRMQDLLAAMDDPELDFGFVFAEVVEFMPGAEPVTKDGLGRTVLNLWRRPSWHLAQNAGEPELFTGHVRYLFDNDESSVRHVLDYVAHLLQRPHERVNHALLITSEEKGIGKSTLGTIIRRLVGERNSGVAQSKDLKSSFDGWLMGKLVVQIDEIYEHGNWDLTNKLKPLITEPTVSVNVKYGPQLVVKNCARLIMFSNHAAPVDLEQGDRRFFVFDSRATPRPYEYYEELNRFIASDEGMSAIYSWLMQRDINGFRPYAAPPLTEAKQRIIEASGNPLRHYILEAVASGHFREVLGHTFTIDGLQRQLQKDGFGQHAKNLKELGAALDEAGVEHVRALVDGKRQRMRRLPGSNPAGDDDIPEF